jgi:hypothetical protein
MKLFFSRRKHMQQVAQVSCQMPFMEQTDGKQWQRQENFTQQGSS